VGEKKLPDDCVSWTDDPTTAEVEEITCKYKAGTLDGEACPTCCLG
jgi:hypothetical protein